MVKPRTSTEFCVFFRSIEGPNRPECLAAWYSSGVGPCTTLSLMSCSGLQLYSNNLVIVREWQEYWHLCLGYILCFVGNWWVYPVYREVWTVEAFLSICFPWFKVEDKLVCETVTRVKFFVGLNSNMIITGSQVIKIVRWVLVLWWEMGYRVPAPRWRTLDLGTFSWGTGSR